MNKRYLSLLMLTSVFLHAQNQQEGGQEGGLVPPEQLEAQLVKAQRDYLDAKEMFDPWYTGPLLTPSANVPSPGAIVIQPYLFVIDTYAKFDNKGKSHSIPDITSIIPQVAPLQVGITERFTMLASFSYQINKQSGKTGSNFGDIPVQAGYGIVKQTAYRPAVLVAVRQNFPTGKYQRLNPNKGGLDATGSGAYQTAVSLNISKIVWWVTKHPMGVRSALQYSFPISTRVHDFNAYGGGFGTDGRVHLRSSFAANLGYEYSFTRHWVAALDALYNYNGKVTFSGCPGLNSDCCPAGVGGPAGQQISLAPAVEYNVSGNLGFIAGIWFTVWGRNANNFVAGIFSFATAF